MVRLDLLLPPPAVVPAPADLLLVAVVVAPVMTEIKPAPSAPPILVAPPATVPEIGSTPAPPIVEAQTSVPAAPCPHCQGVVTPRGRRGLCEACYYTPAIRLLFPLAAVANFYGPALPCRRTDAEPGSAEKVLVLMARAAAGENLFNAADAREAQLPWDEYGELGRPGKAEEVDGFEAKDLPKRERHVWRLLG